MTDFDALVRNARLLLEAGASIDDILSYARAKDDSKATAVRLLQALGLKGDVEASAAWADAADPAYQEDLRKIWREIDGDEPGSG